jgi:branched-subunit amino acid aminotransferase/4-amino-4-deoxychorismate lyase
MKVLVYKRNEDSTDYNANLEKYLPIMLAPYAKGIFETLLVIEGKPVLLERHLERLFLSAEYFSIPLPSENILEELVLKEASESMSGRSALRLSVYHYEEDSSVVLVVPRSYPYSEEIILKGREICISKWKRDLMNPLYQHKTTNQLENRIALENARKKGFDDCIFVNTLRNITEATSSNVFVLSGGVLKTPPESEGILKGITRNIVMDLIREELKDVELREEPVHLEELTQSDEVFLTNSLFGVMPVRKIEDIKIFNHVPGNLTRKIYRLLWEYFYKSIQEI